MENSTLWLSLTLTKSILTDERNKIRRLQLLFLFHFTTAWGIVSNIQMTQHRPLSRVLNLLFNMCHYVIHVRLLKQLSPMVKQWLKR